MTAVVDIIIPTYKREKALRDALRSVLDQTYPYWVCWIAEDGQSDKTCDSIKEFLKDERFKYLPGPHSGSPVKPRNRAFMKAAGNFIAFLDDDDTWLPEKLASQVECMNQNPECILLGSNAYLRKKNQRERTDVLYFKKPPRSNPLSYEELLKTNYIITSSVFMRRDAVNKAGGFNEHPGLHAGEDFEYWLRVAALGEVHYDHRPWVVYQEDSTSFYKKMTRRESLLYKAFILDLVLAGDQKTPSPLMQAQNKRLAALCEKEKAYCLSKTKFLGKLRFRLKQFWA